MFRSWCWSSLWLTRCLSPPSVCTVPPGPVTVPENNTADVQLVKISSVDDVTLTVTVNPEDLFYLRGNALMVKKGLDYEVSRSLHVYGVILNKLSLRMIWTKCGSDENCFKKNKDGSIDEIIQLREFQTNFKWPDWTEGSQSGLSPAAIHFLMTVQEVITSVVLFPGGNCIEVYERNTVKPNILACPLKKKKSVIKLLWSVFFYLSAGFLHLRSDCVDVLCFSVFLS